MRIVGGLHRGRILSCPEGLNTRPTGDRVRESVFNILTHAGWRTDDILNDAYILDVFAGTGAMGVEALSRGGQHAVFIENNLNALRHCEKNIDAIKQTQNARILRQDATELVPRPADIAPRSLVFLDPPYGQDLGERALKALISRSWLQPGAVCVFEMARKSPEKTPDGFTQHDERSYGVATVRFLTWDQR